MFLKVEVIVWANKFGYRTSLGIGGRYYAMVGSLLPEEAERSALALIENPDEVPHYTLEDDVSGHHTEQIIVESEIELKEYTIN